MDDELRAMQRALTQGEPDAAMRLDAILDRREGRPSGVIRRIYDRSTAEPVVFLVDASACVVSFRLPSMTPGIFTPIYVKKMDGSANPVMLLPSKDTTFEGGIETMTIVGQFDSIGPFSLYDKTWVIL